MIDGSTQRTEKNYPFAFKRQTKLNFLFVNLSQNYTIIFRSATSKGDPSDPRPYNQIVEIMYQKIRRPEITDEKANEDYEINLTRLFSAIELAITQSPLTNMQKLTFVKRKLELMQEFGNIRQYRIVSAQLKKFKTLCTADLKEEAKKRKELEREELRLKEIEELRAQTKANANLKAKLAESEGKLLCNQCQTAMYPNAEGFYEFEGTFKIFFETMYISL